MASEDVGMKHAVVYYFLPVAALLIFMALLRKRMKPLKGMIVAMIADRMMKKLHKRLQNEKDVMFSELRNMGRKAGRGLTILEIGSGTGMNFKHFPSGSEIVCLDPNPYNKNYLQKNINELNPKVSLKQFVVGFAESMPEVEDSSCDAVVCTLVLCTVSDVNAVLKEVKRVLKPNGIFFFLEHVAAKRGTFKRRVQDFINPLWKIMCDGCNINRETWNNFNNIGFSDVNLDHFVLTITVFHRRYYSCEIKRYLPGDIILTADFAQCHDIIKNITSQCFDIIKYMTHNAMTSKT